MKLEFHADSRVNLEAIIRENSCYSLLSSQETQIYFSCTSTHISMQFQITPCSSTFAVSVKLTSVFKSLWNGGQPRLQTARLYKAHSIEARLKYQPNKVLIIFPPPSPCCHFLFLHSQFHHFFLHLICHLCSGMLNLKVTLFFRLRCTSLCSEVLFSSLFLFPF